MSLEPVASAATWDALVAAQGGTFFHSHLFLSTLSEGLGLSLDLRAAVVGGERLGAVPLLLKRLGPLSTVNWVPFPYVGPLVPPHLLGATLTALVGLERRALCLRSQHVLRALVPQPFSGFTSTVDRTFVVPLQGRSDDELLAGMSTRRRASIRRAERNGLQIREATRDEITRTMSRLSGDTFERQDLPAPYSAECLELVWDRFAGRPDVLMQTAASDGNPVAVQISLTGGSTGLGWVVGRDRTNEGSDAFAAMIWHTLCWARDRGCTEFDLVGAPTEGIANYKRGLGAEERTYTVLRRQTRVHRTAVQLLQRLPGSRAE